MKTFIYIVIFIVALAVVAGFFIVDSPKDSRLKRFDEQRVGDLSFIQSEIINYWMRKGELPKTLGNLKDDIRGFSVAMDPESGLEYGYEVRGKYDFSLCADFATNNVDTTKHLNMRLLPPRGYPSYDNNQWWGHSAGRVCFERTIDPELYPISKR